MSKTTVVAALIIAVATLIAGATYAYAHDSNPAPATAPAGVSVSDTDTPGDVTVSWQPVAGAAYYRIGWVALDDFHAVTGAGREWLDAFAFTDIANLGQATHTIRGLRTGQEYAFIVATLNSRFGNGAWSNWAYHTPAADPRPTPVIPPPPATATPTPAGTPTPTPVPVGTDYDTDNDGLIEIRTLAQLDAVRHDLDGNGVAQSSRYQTAYPSAMRGMGCPGTCAGYELAQDIDLDNEGWIPIGSPDSEEDWFQATLDGNGHSIGYLTIDWNDADYIGLFRVIGKSGAIRNLQVQEAEVTGQNLVGVIAGENRGVVADVSITGNVTGQTDIGGVVGKNQGIIADASVSGNVSGSGVTGGIAGNTASGSEIIRATVAAAVTAANGGAGGVAARAENATIRLAKATGNVTASAGDAGGLLAGAEGTTIEDSCASGDVQGRQAAGLIGNATDAIINRSCAVGDVTATGYIAGGLTAHARGTKITDSYAYGTIRTTEGGIHRLGGIAADGSNITVRNSYFSGTMHGQTVCTRNIAVLGCASYAGPFYAGIIDESYGTARYSYWDRTVQSNAVGAGTGKSTRELQTPTEHVGIYRRWAAAWDLGDSTQYPVLKGNAMPPGEQRVDRR